VDEKSNKGLRIIVAGSGRLGLSVLLPLLDSHHQVVALAQNGRRTSKLSRAMLPWQYRLMPSIPSPMREAIHDNIPVLWLDCLDESELNSMRAFKPDLIITCGFSIILPPSVLDLPSIGCINVHTALLPKHKGANPCAHVVLDGDTESGVTIHVTEKSIDTGAILAQQTLEVFKTDTSMDVYLKSSAATEDIIVDAVDEIEENGFAHGIPQDPDEGSYDSRFDEEHARIDWTKSAEQIDRLIRAALAYGPAWFEFHSRQVLVAGSIFDASGAEKDPGRVIKSNPYLVVATGNGTIRLLSTYTKRWGGTQWPGAFSGLKPGSRLE
jgi:methionyl-tRNA formyltransferase